MAQTDRPVDPRTISRALALVHEFSEKKSTSPTFRFVCVTASRASAGSTYQVRMVDMPELSDIDLRIARENTEDLISVLRHFARGATQMRIGEREWAFRDARLRCVVPIERDGADVYRRLENIPGRLGSAVICTHDFNMSVYKILSQMKSTEKHSNTDDDVGYVRMTLTGDGAGTSFFCPSEWRHRCCDLPGVQYLYRR